MSNSLVPENAEESASRRRASAPKLTRDLLPAQRGASRPGSHSVFNNLILDDDPLDGSRSLRKRKASSDDVEEAIHAPKKRQRKQKVLEIESEASRSSVSADEDDENDDEDNLREIIEQNNAALDKNRNVNDRSASPRKSRTSRPVKPQKSKNGQGSVSIIKQGSESVILTIQVDPLKLAKVIDLQPKKKRRRPPQQSTTDSRHPHVVPSFSTHYATPFYSFHERENDELKAKPYGGILSEADADTSKTLPLAADRARFNEARQKAEDEWKLKTASSEADGDNKARASQKLAGPPSKIKCVNFGGYEIETWYAAPYPEEYSRNRVLYICEFCLKYMNSDYVAWRHKLKCSAKHPPGDEIYRDKSISVFEVDGRKNPVYCQNLCLLAKLFLGSKTLYYDVEPFLFYVMTEYDELGCHFVGYFSKEKRPSSQNNVSCILTLPTHQRKGYGNLLISFSYLLTRVEGKTGSPEKPLSDMGLVSYRNYWRLVLSYELLNQSTPLSILDISSRTGMTADDIVSALEGLRALVRDPITKTYALRLDTAYFKQCISGWEAKKYVTLNPEALVWTPYIMGRSNLAHYDRAPPLPTIAPREGEDNDDTNQATPEEGVQQSTAAQNPSGKTPCLPNGASPTIMIPPPLPLTPNLTTHPNPPTTAIPPIRYEVFPPIPGTTSRRRGGWRGGPRKSAAATPTPLNPTNGKTNGVVGSATAASASATPVRKGGKVLGKGSAGVGVNGKSAGRRTTRSGILEGEGGKDGVGFEGEEEGDEEVVLGGKSGGEKKNMDYRLLLERFQGGKGDGNAGVGEQMEV